MKKILFASAIILFIAGCAKEALDTTLSYTFSLLNPSAVLSTEAASGTPVAAGSNGSINWTSLTANIAKVEFSASHSGKTITYESKNLYSINPLKSDSLSGSVSIPSGVYENLRFKVTMSESSANPPIVLKGTYIESSGTQIPVVVTLNAPQSFVKEASRIEVTNGTYLAKVVIELNALVRGLTASDFGQTTRTSPNNTIVVNSTTNRALFEKLTIRLPNTIGISVMKK